MLSQDKINRAAALIRDYENMEALAPEHRFQIALVLSNLAIAEAILEQNKQPSLDISGTSSTFLAVDNSPLFVPIGEPTVTDLLIRVAEALEERNTIQKELLRLKKRKG